MPIRPEKRALYPKDWKHISFQIRDRSGGQCECTGECGVEQHTHAPARCREMNNTPARWNRGAKVVLTVAHLNHQPSDCRPENLKAMCQLCHLRYDSVEHRRNRRANLDSESGQQSLFET